MARKKTSPKKHPKMAVLGTFDHFCHIRFLANVLKLDVVLTPTEDHLPYKFCENRLTFSTPKVVKSALKLVPMIFNEP